MKGPVVVLSDEKQPRIARGLVSQLWEHGFQTWDAEHDLLPGDNWGQEILRAIREANVAIVLMPTDPIDAIRCWYLADGLVLLARLGKPTMKIVVGYGQTPQPPFSIDEIVGWLRSL